MESPRQPPAGRNGPGDWGELGTSGVAFVPAGQLTLSKSPSAPVRVAWFVLD